MLALMKRIKRVFNYAVKYPDTVFCKMVLVVRADIAMGKGKTAAQCAHAAVECYRQAVDNGKSQLYESWLMQGQPKIVVRIRNQEELMVLAKKARNAGLITAIIKDAGRTELVPGTISALGIGPGPKDTVDSLTSNLRLL
ncbi:peptidyl-tRNA hydrolase 2, mitochondrial [Halictus rubicundus]|uniref:peptidyl-tRNA hydrolase 2, mitochondrial n=1 Tax=Halictus rubicundus TaxID=77578 RepID=UPI0040372B5F